MATREGFEPPTFGFGDQRSARLNYRAIYLVECDGIEPLGATLLIMPTGLQPAIGNTLR